MEEEKKIELLKEKFDRLKVSFLKKYKIPKMGEYP